MTEKNFNQSGIATKIQIKTGENAKGSWRMTTFGLKYKSFGKTTLVWCKTFGIKEGLPLNDEDKIIIKGGIFFNDSYKTNNGYKNNEVVMCNYASIINDTEHVTLQMETDVPEDKKEVKASAEDSSYVPF